MKKLIVTALVIGFAAVGFFLSSLLRQNDAEGDITIVLVDQIGDTVHSQTYTFSEDDTLFDLLVEHFTIECANMQYQADECTDNPLMDHVLMTVNGIETDWTNTYIAIYVNDEYSNYGIDDIPLHDGDTIRFQYEEVEGAFE